MNIYELIETIIYRTLLRTFVFRTENRGSNAANETDLEGIGLLLQELVTTLGCLLFTLVDLLGHPRGSNLTGHGELLYYSTANRGIGRCRGTDRLISLELFLH